MSDKLEKEPHRYLGIELVDSCEGFELMKDFI